MKYSALIGNPVEHSISPELFDIISKKIGIEYAHIKITVDNKKELENVTNSLKELKFCGFNITCPYKIDMYNLYKEYCDEEAKKIHSINSVTIKNNTIKCYNTDGKAAIKAIKYKDKIEKKDKIVLIGAGGAAYPILYELLKYTENIVIFNEDINKAKEMCNIICPKIKSFNLYDNENFGKYLKESTLIVNATSVGMHPNNEESIISEELMKKISINKKCIFDVIFNPWETKLLKIAQKYNHTTISGGLMLIFQAIYVLELWIDKKIELSSKEIEEITNKLTKILENNYD